MKVLYEIEYDQGFVPLYEGQIEEVRMKVEQSTFSKVSIDGERLHGYCAWIARMGNWNFGPDARELFFALEAASPWLIKLGGDWEAISAEIYNIFALIKKDTDLFSNPLAESKTLDIWVTGCGAVYGRIAASNGKRYVFFSGKRGEWDAGERNLRYSGGRMLGFKSPLPKEGGEIVIWTSEPDSIDSLYFAKDKYYGMTIMYAEKYAATRVIYEAR